MFQEEAKEVYSVYVPEGSEFTGKITVIHDGIYAWYKVSNIISINGKKEELFMIVKPNVDIPNEDNMMLVDIVWAITESTGVNPDNPAEVTQGLIVFPVYKIL